MFQLFGMFTLALMGKNKTVYNKLNLFLNLYIFMRYRHMINRVQIGFQAIIRATKPPPKIDIG